MPGQRPGLYFSYCFLLFPRVAQLALFGSFPSWSATRKKYFGDPKCFLVWPLQSLVRITSKRWHRGVSSSPHSNNIKFTCSKGKNEPGISVSESRVLSNIPAMILEKMVPISSRFIIKTHHKGPGASLGNREHALHVRPWFQYPAPQNKRPKL